MLKHKFVRYLIVGGFAFLIELGSLYGLHQGLGISAVKSVAISFWIGFITAFLLQKLVTFSNTDRSIKDVSRQIAGYVLLVAWNYGFTLLLVKMLVPHFSVYLVRASVMLLITSWNFIIYLSIFKNKQSGKDQN